MKKWMLLTLTALTMLSCGEDPLQDYSKLDSLRILDIQVDIPESNQLDTNVNFSMTPLLSDVGGSGSVSLKWDICIDPGVAFGADPVCPGSSVSQQTHNFVSAMRTEAGAAEVKTYNMSSSVFNSLSASRKFNGVAVLVTLEASNSSKTVRSFKRILYSSKTGGLNTNPSLTGIAVDENSWTTTPTKKSSLKAIFPAASQESYQFKTEDGNTVTLNEELKVTWFSSSGKWTLSRTVGTGATNWTPDGASPSIVVVVLRDGRGGSSFHIQP